MPALEIRGLTKHFGELRALDGVALDVAEGEILGLLGPNGAGKSTLVRALVGRVQPDAGEIRIFDRSAAEPGARDALGYVPQEVALYPSLTAAENLRVFGRYLGIGRSELDAAIRRGLEFANLTDRSGDRVENYSGGMKRRLNIAVGILADPRVVLLDEPTVGVDPQSRERIFEMLEALSARGLAILYTTHYMEEAERLCDRIAIIDHGQVIAEGALDELIRSTIGGEQRILLRSAHPLPPELAGRLPATLGTPSIDGNEIALATGSASEAIPPLLAALEREGVRVLDLELHRPGLERVFLHLTGRELRE